MGYLTKESLDRIATQPGKYTMEDCSVIARELNKMWTFVARFVPASVSANTVTVGAALPLVLCWLASVPYAAVPGATSLPRWLMALAALAELFFQTMDAVDGKHARRLGTSSPLGDFLDHVMDAVSIMTTVFLIEGALHLPFIAMAYVCLVCVSLNFTVIHWESAKILVMRMDNGSSITEAQLSFTAVFAATALFGSRIWAFVPFASVPWLTPGCLCALGLIGAITVAQCIKSLRRVLAKCPPCVLAELFVPIGGALAVALVWLLVLPPAQHSSVPFQAVLLASTVIHSCCITLNRLALQPIVVTSTLPALVPAVIAPLLVPAAYRAHAMWAAAAWALAYMLYFLVDIITSIAKRLNLPVFAQYKPTKTQ